jgi:large subunit ribosomal protein L4
MKRLAIWSALTAKLNDSELVVVDSFPLDAISTKTAAAFLKDVTGGARKSLVIIEEENETVIKSLRNIEGITLRVAPAFSTRDVVNGGVIVATKAAIHKIDSVWAGEEAPNA